MSQLNQAIERFSREGFSLTEFVDAARQDGSLVEKCPDCGSALTGSTVCGGPINEREVIDESAAARRLQQIKRRRRA
jgi:hypothetical protein